MRGNLVAQTTGSRRAELDVLRPVTPAAQRQRQRFGSADERAHSPQRAWLPALSDRRQGKSSSSAAGRLRSDAAGTSPSAISLAEHRAEFGVGPDLPDLLRAAAGDGDLGGPMQRLLA